MIYLVSFYLSSFTYCLIPCHYFIYDSFGLILLLNDCLLAIINSLTMSKMNEFMLFLCLIQP